MDQKIISRMNPFTYLALGDSYTIGEQVLLTESFPYQTVQLLRGVKKQTQDFAAPEIVAKTGWTTAELLAGIAGYHFLPKYNMVSLLIGVNNQYRGNSLDDFKNEFEKLLQMALKLSGNDNKNVFVLSIPDWGQTPFAAQKDQQNISIEIERFNAVCKNMAELYQCNFVDITASQRADAGNEAFLAGDKLHPSGKEYAKWANKLLQATKFI